MNKHHLILFTLILLLNSQGQAATNLTVGISPRLSKESMASWFKTHTTALKAMPGGANVRYIDGVDLRVICDLRIPEVQNERGKEKVLGRALAPLTAWLKQSIMNPSSKDARIDLPNLLDELGRTKSQGNLMLVGSPVYYNDVESDFAFIGVDGPNAAIPTYPSDAHLALTREQSPFGIRNRPSDFLASTHVHWWVPKASDVSRGDYRQNLVRFWTLFISSQGGVLKNFSVSCLSVHENLNNKHLVNYSAKLDPDQTDVAMIGTTRTGKRIFKKIEITQGDVQSMIPPEPFTQVIAIDRTGSMAKMFPKVASRISMLPSSEWYGFYVYGDYHDPKPAFLFDEGDDPSVIAKALRSVELSNGNDRPECLEAALHEIQEELRRRKVEKTNITIFTDAPPHEPHESPEAYDYRALFRKLLMAGHSITVVRCSPSLETEWIPSGVTIESF